MNNIDENSSLGTHKSTGNETGVTNLIKQLADNLSTLFTKEAQLAKAEIRESLDEAKAGIAAMATGLAVAIAGVVAIIMGFIYALSEALPPWAAAFIVGIIALVIGFMMIKAGQNKVKPSNIVPERTVNAVKNDAEMARKKVG